MGIFFSISAEPSRPIRISSSLLRRLSFLHPETDMLAKRARLSAIPIFRATAMFEQEPDAATSP